MSVIYEWDVETVAAVENNQYELGECLDHHHVKSYAEANLVSSTEPDTGEAFQIVLVRDDADGRSWAYLDEHGLPSHFADAAGCLVAKVPQRFVAEVARVAKKC